jgi:D-glycero-D-manno-heptose 1,7-bisphosphate phosphatase
MSVKVVFLDRDGTLNVDHGYVHTWEQWQLVGGAAEALQTLTNAGFQLAVVSNQSGIARGMFSRDDVDRLHRQMLEQLTNLGITVAAVAYCPHGPDDECLCRKPRTELGQQVQATLGEPIDFQASWTIGDKPSDIVFGQSLGTRAILLRSRYWSRDTLSVRPDHICDDLREAAEAIRGR